MGVGKLGGSKFDFSEKCVNQKLKNMVPQEPIEEFVGKT